MFDVQVFAVPEPLPRVEVLLPDKAGKLRGKVATVEWRPDGTAWIEVLVPSWVRWSTQLAVGEPSTEGIGPGTVRMWAPSEAVIGDEDDVLEIKRLHRESLTAA